MDTIISHSPSETRDAGRVFARCLDSGSVVALCGDLGAGKTLFCRGLVEGLGGDPEEVSSPTFTVVHEYETGRIPVFHFDFYRLESEGALQGVGWEDFLHRQGVVLVEWADRFAGHFPNSTQWVHFRFGGEAVRIIEVGR